LRHEYAAVRVALEEARCGWNELASEYAATRSALEDARGGWAALQKEYVLVRAECQRRGELLTKRAA
jgi:hypothetical protein